MKKLLIVLVVLALIICGAYVIKHNKTNEVDIENTLSVSNEVKDEDNTSIEEVKENIKIATQKYFNMLYGEKISEIKINSIKVYEGQERIDVQEFVDLDEKDQAFEISIDIKPASKDDVKLITEYLGKYDEESGWITEEKGYGVMRFNNISKEFDVTSIRNDSF